METERLTLRDIRMDDLLEEIAKWTLDRPVIIEAGTDTGKSYLIKTVLSAPKSNGCSIFEDFEEKITQ